MIASLSTAASVFNTVSRQQTWRRRLSSCITMAKEGSSCWHFSSDLSFLLCGQKQTVASLGMGYGGGGNKGHLTYIDRRECIFFLKRPYSAHKLGKEDIVFLSYRWRFEMHSVRRSIR